MMRLDKAIQLFLGEHKPSTAASYRHELKLLAEFVGPARPVDQVAPEQLLEHIQHLRARGLKQTTVNKHTKTIKSFFNWMVRLEFVAKSPAYAIKVKKLDRRVSPEKAMTDSELTAILYYVQGKPRDIALIRFIADTGCRAGGAATLKIADLDLANRSAVVTEKGDKTRPVFYGQATADALRYWLAVKSSRSGQYVFRVFAGDKPLDVHNIAQVIRRACDLAGVRSLGPHSLRHRKGHQMADARIAASVAATVLGHSDVNTTLTHYYPADYDRAREVVEALSMPSEQPMQQPPKVLKMPRSS